MGRGNKSDQYLNTTWFKVQGLKKGSTEVYLEGKQKIDGKYVWDGQKDSFIQGTIIGCTAEVGEYEGEKIHSIKVTLQDKADAYVLSLSFSMLGISLLNSLAWASKQYDQLSDVKLSVYMSKAGYPSIFTEVNGEKSDWLMEWDTIKPYITYTDLPDGKTHTDKSKLIVMLTKLIEDVIKPKLSKEIPKSDFETKTRKKKANDHPPADYFNPEETKALESMNSPEPKVVQPVATGNGNSNTAQENSSTLGTNGRTDYGPPADANDLPF